MCTARKVEITTITSMATTYTRRPHSSTFVPAESSRRPKGLLGSYHLVRLEERENNRRIQQIRWLALRRHFLRFLLIVVSRFVF